jgi:multiple sugar transport system substrate-binding protein
MSSRRRLLATGGLAAIAATPLGGCIFGGDRDETAGELRIVSGKDESRGRQRRRLVDLWNRDHPDYPARIIEVGGVADAHRSEMVAWAQSGQPVDVYNLDVTWTAEFVEAEYVEELRADRPDDFLEQPLRTCEYDGKLWALPFNTDAGLLYYRSDLVPDAEALIDWGDIESRVDEVLGSPDRPDRMVAGYATQLADYEGLTVNALEMIWATFGEVAAGDWRDPEILVESPQVQAALARLAKVNDPASGFILPESLQADENATTAAFREGKVVFMRNWPVAYRSLQAPAGDAPVVVPFAVRRLPGPSVLGGQNLAIARQSPRPRAAQSLIEFLTSEQSQLALFADGGLAATRPAVYDDPGIVAAYPYAPVLREAIEGARQRPVTPYYAPFSEVFRAGVRAALGMGGTLTAGFAGQLTDAMRGLQR